MADDASGDARRRFFLAEEDEGLMGDEDDGVQPIIEFGRKKPCRSKRPTTTEKPAEKRCPKKRRR